MFSLHHAIKLVTFAAHADVDKLRMSHQLLLFQNLPVNNCILIIFLNANTII